MSAKIFLTVLFMILQGNAADKFDVFEAFGEGEELNHFLELVDVKNNFLLGDAGCKLMTTFANLFTPRGGGMASKNMTSLKEAICNEANKKAVNAVTPLFLCLKGDPNKQRRVDGSCVDKKSLDMTNCSQASGYAICRAKASGKECGIENVTALIAGHIAAVASQDTGNCKDEVIAALRNGH